MNEVIQFVKDHAADFLALYGAVVAVATIVVKLTPSQKDDAILAKVVAFLDKFSTVNPK